jgi:uncharacterized protein (DUF1800 family)
MSNQPSERPEGLPSDPSTDSAPARSRRSFVFFGALAGVAALAPRAARAQQPKKRIAVPKGISRDLVPVPSTVPALPEWASLEGRLVRRVTNGASAADVALAQSMTYQDYLETQLHYTEIDDSAVDSIVATRYPLLSQTVDQLLLADAGTLQEQLQEAMVYRAAFSKRQLYQRMVEFWSDHFNILYGKVQQLKAVDDRDVIRAYALDKFPNLLRASAHSPAMLGYLDQNQSTAGAPNQNYAREIMELHTLGVNGGYTQTDVAELSRVLTGWTYTGHGVFSFNPGIHDWGSKTVLGVTIPASSPSAGAAGINEGEQMLNVLANHPSTAQFIATRMLQWLLTPAPTTQQISAIASVYRATGGDIKLMARAILNDAWVAQAPAKYKRPFHFMVSTLRCADPTVTSLTSLNQSQGVALGQPLFQWITPDGYPDTVEYWSGNIMTRWSYGSTFASQNSAATIQLSTAPYLAGTADAAVDLMGANFFAGEMSSTTRAALLGYLKGGTFNDARVRETIALAFSASGFQWY